MGLMRLVYGAFGGTPSSEYPDFLVSSSLTCAGILPRAEIARTSVSRKL